MIKTRKVFSKGFNINYTEILQTISSLIIYVYCRLWFFIVVSVSFNVMRNLVDEVIEVIFRKELLYFKDSELKKKFRFLSES